MDEDSDDLGYCIYTAPCGYFDDRINEFQTISINPPSYSDLLRNITSLKKLQMIQDLYLSELFLKFDYFLSRGYRRSGNLLYNNVCEECSRCIPIRIPVKDFVMTKRYRRILRNNSDIEIRAVKPEITDEKIKLFQKYNALRHDHNNDCLEHLSSLHYGYDGIYEMDYFLDNKLIAVGILDLGDDSSSSNYFYFDPQYSKRSLGVFSVLKEIEFTQQSGRIFYYLGFYIEESEKMRYKSQYQPAQVRIDNKWVDFDKTKLTVYKSSN